MNIPNRDTPEPRRPGLAEQASAPRHAAPERASAADLARHLKRPFRFNFSSMPRLYKDATEVAPFKSCFLDGSIN
ncbi:hypothetical protein [Burkholderia glumae]|uniref:hypothetical protein n=1 Tax=Burkholderia glumae TaxID=337 RepID=UPI0012D30584|nr:hypothetical protein [Burkholderia glumae]